MTPTIPLPKATLAGIGLLLAAALLSPPTAPATQPSATPVLTVAPADAAAADREAADAIAGGEGDQEVIQQAIDQLARGRGGTVRLLGGTFRTNAPIVLPDAITLEGTPAAPPATAAPAAADAADVAANDARLPVNPATWPRSATLIELDPEHRHLGLHEGMIRVTGTAARVRHLRLDGGSPDPRRGARQNRRSSGIYLDIDSRDCVIEHIEVANTTRHGVAVLGSGHRLSHIHASRSGMGYCISFGDGSRVRPGVSDVVAEDLWVRDAGHRSGIEVNDGAEGIVIRRFYSGGHGAPSRGAVHVREHGRSDEFVRDLLIEDGVVDLGDTELELRDPCFIGLRILAPNQRNRFDNITVRNLRFHRVPGHAIEIVGNVHDVTLENIDARDIGGDAVRLGRGGGDGPRGVVRRGIQGPGEE